MNKLGLKCLLQEATAFSNVNKLVTKTFLLVLVTVFFTYGCAGLNKKSSSTFHPEYYAGKNLTTNDIVTLRENAALSDSNISAASSLVLGIYYLRYGDKNYGKFLIKKYYKDKNLNDLMLQLGQLWYLEVLKHEKNEAEIDSIYNSILSGILDENLKKAFTLYCASEGVKFIDMATAKFCINKRIGRSDDLKAFVDKDGTVVYDDIPEATSLPYDNLTYDEYTSQIDQDNFVEASIPKDATINIIGGDILGEIVNGMIYAIHKTNAEFHINSIPVSLENTLTFNDSEVYLRIKDLEVSHGGTVANLSINWHEIAKTITLIKSLEKYKNVVISADLNKLPFARYIRNELALNGVDVKIFNYEIPTFQAALRAYLDSKIEENVLLIGLGDEEDIIKFLPVAKFLVSKPDKQKILLAMSSISYNYLNSDYKSYFKEIDVITPVELINDPNFKNMNMEYFSLFGKNLTIKNLLGFDTISYMNGLTDSEIDINYVTGITEFVDGIAHRPIKRYRFNKHLFFDQQPLELREELVEPEVPAEQPTDIEVIDINNSTQQGQPFETEESVEPIKIIEE